MFNSWIKPYLPRTLFKRAFLILIVPIVLIQVVVGVVFVERLFQDVSRQMTHSVSIDINHLINLVRAGEDPMLTAKSLQIDTNWIENPNFEAEDRYRDVYDFAGWYVIETLHNEIPEVRSIDLGRSRGSVFILTNIDGKGLEFQVARTRVSASNPHQLLVYMIFAALLLSILAALFLRNQIKPIRRLARAAEAFGKGQNLPLNPRGASEVRSAATAFLSMRARIERQIEQRTMMLSGVSHDLRTPLTRLRLSVSLMEQDDETAMIQQDLNEMEDILDEFLAFARGDSEEQVERVSPKALAEQLVENMNRNGHTVSLAFEGARDADETVKIRRTAVHRAISNLLSNALKYGNKTNLNVYTGAGFVEFVVEDNGPGIDPDQRANAVKPFARLDSARNQDKGAGVGLGLAIAADVARSHGGSLTLSESDDLGGLKAAFRLPR
jgi:two-component system osmolarity sensor histidine kinase EnvZ